MKFQIYSLKYELYYKPVSGFAETEEVNGLLVGANITFSSTTEIVFISFFETDWEMKKTPITAITIKTNPIVPPRK